MLGRDKGVSDISEHADIKDLASVEESPDILQIAHALVRSIERRKTSAGKPYFDLELGDCSRTFPAKIWGDRSEELQAAGELEPGMVVKVAFQADRYQGSVQLNIKRLRRVTDLDEDYDEEKVFGAGYPLIKDLACETLVFDIETVPRCDRRDLPKTVAETVAKHAEKHSQDESMVMGLSPYLGKIVSLAFGDGEKSGDDQAITVLAVPPQGREDDDFPEWIRPMSEADLLRAFWCLAALSKRVVSFNGTGFDVPFLIGRSLIHEIDVHVDLVSRRWSNQRHIDLLPILGGRWRGPSTLDVVCWSLGIESPKGEMDGSMVAPAYARGEIENIATYNAHDVRATSAVYNCVRDRLLRFTQSS